MTSLENVMVLEALLDLELEIRKCNVSLNDALVNGIIFSLFLFLHT